jgi:hypothetical protein
MVKSPWFDHIILSSICIPLQCLIYQLTVSHLLPVSPLSLLIVVTITIL